MVFLDIALVALVLGKLLGGRLTTLADTPIRGKGLAFAAIGIQLIAFPSELLPWSTPSVLARGLWLCSYGLLVAMLLLNVRFRGTPLIAAGLVSNVIAIVANGGLMPVRGAALEASRHRLPRAQQQHSARDATSRSARRSVGRARMASPRERVLGGRRPHRCRADRRHRRGNASPGDTSRGASGSLDLVESRKAGTGQGRPEATPPCAGRRPPSASGCLAFLSFDPSIEVGGRRSRRPMP